MNRGRVSIIFTYIVTFLCGIVAVLGTSRVITVISEGLPIDDRRCIIIDAGHGGMDGGAISCTGKSESGINLEIALRLEDLFHLLGYQTKMIRREDISVYTKGETIAQKKVSDLKERVRICNETQNGILVSIHQNQFTDSRYSGAQAFYGKDEDSKKLAHQVQSAFQMMDPNNKRENKKANGVYLMEHIQCPGILVECGFLSNPEEEAKLRTATYQQQICCTIVASVSNFLDG